MLNPNRFTAGLVFLLVAPLGVPDARAVDCDAIPSHFSTSTNQFGAGLPVVYRQNVYSSSVSAGTSQLLPNFLPAGLNLDALHVIDPSTVLFSVDVNGYVATPSGLVRLLNDRVYRLDASSGGVAIDPDWAALGIAPRSLDAVYRGADGCFAFSVARSGLVTHGGASVYARPWEVYRVCPSAPVELVFDGGPLGITGVDAVHTQAGVGIEFSTIANKLLPGGVRLWSQNVYRCAPTGPDRTCAPAELSTVFDGVTRGLSDLDAFSGDDLTSRVTLGAVRGHQAALQAIADANGGSRLAGTPGFDQSASYVAGLLEAAGYDVTIQPYVFSAWLELGPPVLQQAAPLAATYAEQVDFVTMTYSDSGDVTAPVTAVDLALGDPSLSTSGCEAADFAGFPVGHIALIQRGPCSFQLKAENAASAGALAVIIFNQGNDPSRTGLINGTLGSGFAGGIPVVFATFDRGVEWATTPGLVMRVHVDATDSPFSTANIIAETPGGDPDRVVMVGASLDSPIGGPGIQANGSGSAAVLETALQLSCVEPFNKVRFAWWSTSELTSTSLRGSDDYLANLTAVEKERIALYLNFDSIGSPNFVRFVYDGDGSGGGPAGPLGSDAIEQVFASFYAAAGLAFEETPLSTPFSDHTGFINQGIPVGGIFTGEFGIKSVEQAATYGGTAGDQYDPCWRLACDTFDNISLSVLDVNSDAVAYSTLRFALDTSPVTDP